MIQPPRKILPPSNVLRRILLTFACLGLACACASLDIRPAPEAPNAPSFVVHAFKDERDHQLFAHNVEAALLSHGMRVVHGGEGIKQVERTRSTGSSTSKGDPEEIEPGFSPRSDSNVSELKETFSARETHEADYVVHASLQRTGFIRVVDAAGNRLAGNAETRVKRSRVQEAVKKILDDMGLSTGEVADDDTAYVRKTPLQGKTLVVVPFNEDLDQMTFAKVVEEGLLAAGMILAAPPDALREITYSAKRRDTRDEASGADPVDPIEAPPPEDRRGRLDVRKDSRKETFRAWPVGEADFIVRTLFVRKKGYECAVSILRRDTRELVAAFWTPTSSPQIKETVARALAAMTSP